MNFLEIEYIARMIISLLLGALIGLERESIRRPAGLRTHMLVSLGSTLFMIASLEFNLDPARIAAGVVTGMGFIGAGTIMAEKERNKEIVLGVTTAASLWTTSAIGLLVGMGEFTLAITAAVLTFIVLISRLLESKDKKFSV